MRRALETLACAEAAVERAYESQRRVNLGVERSRLDREQRRAAARATARSEMPRSEASGAVGR